MKTPFGWLPPPGVSLRWKLPALMCGLVGGALLLHTAIAYDQLEETLVEAAADRMAPVLDILAATQEQTSAQHVSAVRSLADSEAVVRMLSGDTAGRSAVLGAMTERMQREGAVVSLSAWRTDGVCVAEVWRLPPGPSEDDPPRATETGCSDRYPAPSASLVATGGFAALEERSGVLSLALLVPVTVDGERLGHVFERRMGSSRPGAELMERVVSSDALLLAGNAGGDFWTDFEKRVSGPPLAPVPGEPLEYEDAEGTGWLGVGVEVPGTPWVFWLQRERRAIVAPARAYLYRSALVIVLVLAVALPTAWVVSARITVPLQRVTRAAEEVAGGDYARRVEVDRADEIGRLGEAFNVMAAEVAAARDALAARVAERTRELEAALAELRETQDQLIRKEKLAVLGALAGGVGHELRTPLSVLTNALYVIEREVAGGSDKVREYLEMCRLQLSTAEKIIGDLLELGRVREPVRKPTSVAALVDAQLQRLDGAEAVCIERETPADLPDALVDPVQMGQVVFNVLVNARQAMEADGGTLSVSAAAEDGGAVVVLEVTDTGVGIPAEDLDRIFEPLYTTKPYGFGIGLAVSRELANANDADIHVTSTVGAGTTVTLRMPTVAGTGGQSPVRAEGRDA